MDTSEYEKNRADNPDLWREKEGYEEGVFCSEEEDSDIEENDDDDESVSGEDEDSEDETEEQVDLEDVLMDETAGTSPSITNPKDLSDIDQNMLNASEINLKRNYERIFRVYGVKTSNHCKGFIKFGMQSLTHDLKHTIRCVTCSNRKRAFSKFLEHKPKSVTKTLRNWVNQNFHKDQHEKFNEALENELKNPGSSIPLILSALRVKWFLFTTTLFNLF